jgi:opacity protein-like surface antigen
MKKLILASVLSVLGFSSVVNASTIELDMSTWETDGDGEWTYDDADNSWLQTINGSPTVLFDPNQSSINSAISGTISVETTNDDDWIGFVLGYQDDEIYQDAGTDYWLVDWKRGEQSGAPEGLLLSHVTGAEGGNNWSKGEGSGYEVVAVGDNLGTVGWESFTDYTFDILFDSNLIEVFINDQVEISITAQEAGVDAFLDGSFGFYNYSQSHVKYSEPYLSPVEDVVSEEGKENLSVSVPEPASAAVFGLGIAGLFFSRRKRKAI